VISDKATVVWFHPHCPGWSPVVSKAYTSLYGNTTYR